MNLIDCYREVLGILERQGKKIGRRAILETALKSLQEDLESERKPFYIIRAPTGYGKTTFSYSLLLFSLPDNSYFEKIIHVLPMRSIIEDAYKSASSLFGCNVGYQMMDSSRDPFLLRHLTFTTVDTFTYDLMKLNTAKIWEIESHKRHGYDYFTQASVLLSAIVFDEAHTILENKYMAGAFLTVLNVLLKFGTPIFVMTATISSGYAKQLKKRAKDEGYAFRIIPEFNEEIEDDFFKRERNKKFKIRIVKGHPLEFIEEGKINLIVVNRVDRAIKIYKELEKRDVRSEKLLIHGRFKSSDRNRIMDKLIELKKSGIPYIIVSTQVIEAGVDMSSDVLITDFAPLSSLIQRMGRNARYEEEEGKIYLIDLSYLGKKASLPYSNDVFDLTLRVIKENSKDDELNINPRIPREYQFMLDKIYRNIMYKSYNIEDIILNPFYRAEDVLRELKEEIKKKGAFLREYPLLLTINGEDVPISEYILKKLLDIYPGSIYCNGKPISKEDIKRIKREVALGKKRVLSLEDNVARKIYNDRFGLHLEGQ
ncbi:CRISPR-associated helicase Cas3' [Candidatus Methanodesulfokora washburnensis]|jgi:CRISPR-associated endonuclease/helicase Cas3|uniref:CRISPR-associated helicase Cas3 n=1 Tax=Candidatus Methanodesulfokora washburnensis TaxID=2478471 RepID=A0A3R9PUC5_9CREN|nr:CRISPR-associated helicase Cas3' [Candidatus Methanodesulfokores washburnensis]RSN73288.1 CRISPR-associated helicase Cas3' [Candidatus Methanodesulfokores washburnensis]